MLRSVLNLGLYELVLVFKFTDVESETSRQIDIYKNFVLEYGSKVMVKSHCRKVLAYQIKGFDLGIVLHLRFEADYHLIKELNTRIERDPLVIRCISRKLR